MKVGGRNGKLRGNCATGKVTGCCGPAGACIDTYYNLRCEGSGILTAGSAAYRIDHEAVYRELDATNLVIRRELRKAIRGVYIPLQHTEATLPRADIEGTILTQTPNARYGSSVWQWPYNGERLHMLAVWAGCEYEVITGQAGSPLQPCLTGLDRATSTPTAYQNLSPIASFGLGSAPEDQFRPALYYSGLANFGQCDPFVPDDFERDVTPQISLATGAEEYTFDPATGATHYVTHNLLGSSLQGFRRTEDVTPIASYTCPMRLSDWLTLPDPLLGLLGAQPRPDGGVPPSLVQGSNFGCAGCGG